MSLRTSSSNPVSYLIREGYSSSYELLHHAARQRSRPIKSDEGHDVLEIRRFELGEEVSHPPAFNLPLDDTETYELLSSGNASGVFQLESRGCMRDLLTKLKPSKFEDIIALIALYRPGPLMSGMMEEFIKRKNNPALIKYETGIY